MTICCDALGFDPYGNLRVAKSSDFEALFNDFPAGFDFTNYSGVFQVRASEDAADPPLLEVSDTPTPEGSVLVYASGSILIRLKLADLATLPENPDDSDEPWVGVFEWRNTDTANLQIRFLYGTITVERGVIR